MKDKPEEILIFEENIALIIRRCEFLLIEMSKLKKIYIKIQRESDAKKEYGWPNFKSINYLVFHYNLYFNDVLVHLASLFSRNSKEICFLKLNNKYQSSNCLNKNQIAEYHTILNEYENSQLKKVRDSIVAHKDTKSNSFNSIFGGNLYADSHVEDAERVVKKLKEYMYKYFLEISSNSEFDYYEKSFKIIEDFLFNLSKKEQSE